MKVSICIPSYNAEDTILATVESLLCQSHDDIEIIITDNSDNYSIKEALACIDDKRLLYFHNGSNIGYESNIRKSVDQSKSDIVSIFHSDDIYEREIIEKEVAVLENRADISAVFTSNMVFFDNNLNNRTKSHEKYKFLDTLDCYDPKTNAYVFERKNFYHTVCRLGNIFTCPTMMIRKELFYEMDGFNRKFPSCEDIDLCFRMLNNGSKIALVKEDLINYRVTKVQGGAEFRRSEDLPMLYNVIDHYKEDFSDILDKKIEYDFALRKASGYIKAATNSAANNSERFLDNINKSKEYFRYPILSRNGLFQLLGRFLNNRFGKKIISQLSQNEYNW